MCCTCVVHVLLYVCCTVLYCTVLLCTVLHCTALHCTALYCTVLYCTVLYCTVLQYNTLLQVSLVVPGKRLYELVYNRLGNDLLLWLPQYLVVKEFLYGEPVVDPLHDDTAEFRGDFQGRPQAVMGGGEGGEAGRGRRTTAFPKDREVGALEIHTDTAVLLNINQAQVLVHLT